MVKQKENIHEKGHEKLYNISIFDKSRPIGSISFESPWVSLK